MKVILTCILLFSVYAAVSNEDYKDEQSSDSYSLRTGVMYE